MANYSEDRTFTNYIHQHVAMPRIYHPLHWQKLSLDQAYAEEMDMQRGIDYVFRRPDNKLVTVQERFRESKYRNYSDFTIRYRRDENPESSRIESEYYKMKADYFTYGIANCLKPEMTRCTGFIKFAVIDLKKVYQKIDAGLIEIRYTKQSSCCLEDGKIISPVLYNRDGSSSFFPVEISFLVQLWGEEIIVAQKGFY